MAFLSPLEIEIVVKLVVAASLGLILGFEREMHKRPAGLRTHSLICMGAALFTVLSMSIVGENVDASRIAAGIVTGIGFIGGGMIFKSDDRVIGLTTAAEIWVVGAIGIAVGVGYYFAAGVATAIVLFILVPLKHLADEAKRKAILK
ncbi:MAG: MgtC/SapB family protein [Candidatus Aenigmarchaeota archaeon]|nr:MgtC/SapB family protein [Candidatus Aenigmarchaeota archaeon]